MSGACHSYNFVVSSRSVTNLKFIYACMHIFHLLVSQSAHFSQLHWSNQVTHIRKKRNNTKFFSKILKESQGGLGVDVHLFV